MNREIKFRGKRIDTGEWVCGFYWNMKVQGSDLHYIRCINKADDFPVKAETVGQYIGLKDKNGKEICEGDISAWVDDDLFGVAQVKWSQEELQWKAYCNDWGDMPLIEFEFEVIGNIYENPELLA